MQEKPVMEFALMMKKK